MGRKFVSHYYLSLLSLCLIAIPVNAEESILLIDNTQGIDNTRSSIIDELNKISESLDSIEAVEKTDDEQDDLIESDINDKNEDYKDTNNTLLIDDEKGIDNTHEPIIDALDSIDETLDVIETRTDISSEEEELIEADSNAKPDSEQAIQNEINNLNETDSNTQLKSDTEIDLNAGSRSILIDNTLGIDGVSSQKENKLNTTHDSVNEVDFSDDIDSDLIDQTKKTAEQINLETGPSILLIDNTQDIDRIDELISPLINKKTSKRKTPDNETISKEQDQQINDQIATESKKSLTKQKSPIESVENKTVNKSDKTKKQKNYLSQKYSNKNDWPPKNSDLRILELRVGAYTFEDVIGAYQFKNTTLLPLNEISNILDLAITVNPNFAQGFIIKQSNTFILDTNRNEVIIKGKINTYQHSLVKNLDGEIYVESSLLANWLNIEFDIDLYASRVWVRSEEKLPFLSRIERENRIARSLTRLNQNKHNYPRHFEAYNNYSVPFINQTLNLSQRLSDAENVTTFNTTTYATADFLQHESTWYLTADEQNGINDFRVTLGRTDHDGELLGFMNAREYKVGHVAEPRIGLINVPNLLKTGFTVSNYPIGIQSEYDRHRFIGELLPGWEVELYRNNALIGYQQTAVNGQYDFKDVPLLFGSNHFRLTFYGPKGEIREESTDFQLSQSMTKKGQHYYRASLISDETGSQRTTIQYDYGISKSISSTFNLVSIPIKETAGIIQHDYVSTSLTGYWDSLLASTTFVDDSESGSAVEIDLQTRISEITINLNDIYLDGFFSEEYQPSATEITRRSRLTINTAIPSSFLPRIPLTIGVKRDQYKNGGELFEINNQLSMSAYGIAITNQLNHQQVNDQQATANGSFQISTHVNQTRLRSTINYALKPDNELTNLALTIDPGKYGDYRLSMGVNHSLQQKLTEYSITANKLSSKYNLSFGARYNSNNEINFDISISFGFGYEPRRKQWKQDSRMLANQGSASIQFFLDANQDGIYNQGDEPIQDIGVRLNGGYSQERSDEEGILFLKGIPAHQPSNLVIAPETLVDPLWAAAINGFQVIPRPGHAVQIDFPIQTTGEIDGTVYLSKFGRKSGVGRVTVEAVDKNNRVISTTETSYDGFYILSKIPLGEYYVRISETQLRKLAIQFPSRESISITSDEPYINGIDFNLKTTKIN